MKEDGVGPGHGVGVALWNMEWEASRDGTERRVMGGSTELRGEGEQEQQNCPAFPHSGAQWLHHLPLLSRVSDAGVGTCVGNSSSELEEGLVMFFLKANLTQTRPVISAWEAHAGKSSQ